MEKFLRVGKIINVHGIKGEVKILPLTDHIERFFTLKIVYLEKESFNRLLTIQNIRIHKNLVLVKFKEITTRDQAEKLKDSFIDIRREDAIKLSKDQYFISDLIGVLVYSIQGKKIGIIKEVLQIAPTDIYVIDIGDREILVPALKEIFQEIDIYKKIAKADIPKDLMNL
ncbi:ribosome maturation factor RimM [Garciella nitratireducens]|uniref:Ribosome maturation factor RimM n=1 Tax=Garciella nitratireducens DSM 15102 TaxID=1121911 RepID=A0A1T4JXG4_9FIRM|nr:ribosome maturation factor RimM [Garciella nitratireducens]RBP41141.1 16S rRNA processing protein RimM [Garciella nitratireducens]SJZ34962.1 16S rRNA processing protein RimM [Garciella nitratireducens DSM 15102]